MVSSSAERVKLDRLACRFVKMYIGSVHPSKNNSEKDGDVENLLTSFYNNKHILVSVPLAV